MGQCGPLLGIPMKPTHLFAATAGTLFALHCHALPGADGQPGSAGKAKALDSGLRILSSPHYRAVFCGQDSTETSAAYSRALASDLRRLEKTGRSTIDALAYLERRACPGKSFSTPGDRPLS